MEYDNYSVETQELHALVPILVKAKLQRVEMFAFPLSTQLLRQLFVGCKDTLVHVLMDFHSEEQLQIVQLLTKLEDLWARVFFPTVHAVAFPLSLRALFMHFMDNDPVMSVLLLPQTIHELAIWRISLTPSCDISVQCPHLRRLTVDADYYSLSNIRGTHLTELHVERLFLGRQMDDSFFDDLSVLKLNCAALRALSWTKFPNMTAQIQRMNRSTANRGRHKFEQVKDDQFGLMGVVHFL